MTENAGDSKDVLLTLSYWTILALSVLSLTLVLVLLLLMMARGVAPDASVWILSQPFLVAIIPWMYLDILAREYKRLEAQRPQLWLMLVSAAGSTVLVLMCHALLNLPHGFDPSHLIIWIPWLVGCLSFVTVGRIILRTRTSAKTAHFST